MQHEKVTIVDVRNEEDYEEQHISNAIFLDQYNFNDFVEATNKEQMIIVCCYRGNRSKKTVSRLTGKGFKEVYNLTGGFKDWVSKS
jgi:thiosulfate sulfurtransferase